MKLSNNIEVAKWLIEQSCNEIDGNVNLFSDHDQRWLVNRAQSAITLANAAVSICRNAEALYQRAMCYLQFSIVDSAKDDLKEALKLTDNNDLKRIIYRQLGDLSSVEEREKYYQKANVAI